jgi:chemotaxis response regulator CheB
MIASATAGPASEDGVASQVVAIAASAGGVLAIRSVLSQLPADFDAAVLVMIHVSPNHISRLDEVYSKHCKLDVTMAMDGEPLRPGHVYIAVSDRHFEVDRQRCVRLTSAPKQHFTRPSAEPLFLTASRAFGHSAILVVLTGGGDDGSESLRQAKECGAIIIAQDPANAEHPAMPLAAIESGAVDTILPLEEIPRRLMQLIGTRVATGGETYRQVVSVQNDIS